MTDTLYLSLWAVYLVSIGLAFLLLWNLTLWPKGWIFLARFIRLLFLSVMLIPAPLMTNPDLMAPAVVVAPFDLIQGNEEGAFNALVNIVIASLCTVIIFVIYLIIRLIVHSRKDT